MITRLTLHVFLFFTSSLQISYLDLDTKEWFASLDAVDSAAMSCNETKLEAQRKRMKTALTEDANVAARIALPFTKDSVSSKQDSMSDISSSDGDKEGVFVGGMPFKRLSDLNLKSLAEREEKSVALRVKTDPDDAEGIAQLARNGSIPKESNTKMTSARKFSFETFDQSMKHSTSLSSFVELFTPELRPAKPPSRRTSFIDIDAPAIDVADDGVLEISASGKQAESGFDSIIDEAIDNVLESSNCEKEGHGLFLREISKFLSEADAPFQHVDLWVPMDVSHSDIASKNHVGGSSVTFTSSSNKVSSVIYGSQDSSVRLSNAGYITVRAPQKIMGRLNEVRLWFELVSCRCRFGSITNCRPTHSLACTARTFPSPPDLVCRAACTSRGLRCGRTTWAF